MKDHQGIVVFGHPRSGTTLLRRILNSHSSIASPPETHLFSACAKFIEKDFTADGVDMGVLSGLNFAGFEDEFVVAELKRFAFQFLEAFAEKEGKRRWAEKTAFDIFHLNEIERICGDEVFYLGIIRHPLDVALSSVEFCNSAGVYPKEMHKYIQRYSRPLEAFTHSWIDTTNSLIELGHRRAGNCLIVRYEDLVNDPEVVISDVLEAVGEKFELGFCDKIFSQMDVLGFSDHKNYQAKSIHKDSIGRWEAISRPQVGRLANLLNPLLEQCGYELLNAIPPYSLDTSRRRYLSSLLIHANDNLK